MYIIYFFNTKKFYCTKTLRNVYSIQKKKQKKTGKVREWRVAHTRTYMINNNIMISMYGRTDQNRT